MSSRIKKLYDYELVKKCGVCKFVSLKSNFYKNKTERDSCASECISCRKQYDIENREKIKKILFGKSRSNEEQSKII